MLMIRLTRVGKKKDSSFRVVVVDSKKKVQAGNYLEMVGSYDPRVDSIELKGDRITHWLSKGAQPSDTVHNLLVTKKIIDAKKINVLPRKSAPQKEEKQDEEVTQAPAQSEEVADTPAADAPKDEVVEKEVASEAKSE